MRKKIGIALAFIVLLAIMAYVSQIGLTSKDSSCFENNDDLQVYFFDAGKADAALIKQKDHYIMIDTGEYTLIDTILDYLKTNQIDHLDYLIITHFDKDHVGSAGKLIQEIQIDHILQCNEIKDSIHYENYMNALEVQKIQAETIEGIKEIQVGDLTIKVEGSRKRYEKSSSNNASLITSIYYENTSMVFMGDIENARIKDYLTMHKENYDFMKVPYHGRLQNQLERLINRIEPKYAVITCSKDENEDSETISLLKQVECSYYLTRKGPILVKSDGNTIHVKQEKDSK